MQKSFRAPQSMALSLAFWICLVFTLLTRWVELAGTVALSNATWKCHRAGDCLGRKLCSSALPMPLRKSCVIWEVGRKSIEVSSWIMSHSRSVGQDLGLESCLSRLNAESSFPGQHLGRSSICLR